MKLLAPCKIVDNIVIGDEGPLYKERYSLGELLFDKLNSDPNFVGQIDSSTNKWITFAEIKERSVRCALWLKSQGVKRGDIISISTPRHSDCSIPLLGCLFIGASFYPMHFGLSIQEYRYFVSLVKPKAIFVHADSAKNLIQAVEEEKLAVELITFGRVSGLKDFQEIIDEQNAMEVDKFCCTPIASLDETALFMLSSGTTGPSKAIMLSHRGIINNMLYDYSFAEKDHNILTWLSPLRWVTGTLMILRSIFLRKRWIICREYDAELLCKVIQKYNVEWVFLHTSVPIQMIRNGLLLKYRLPSLRKLIMAGKNIKPQAQEELMKLIPHVDISVVYGMTELSGISSIQKQSDKFGSCGYLIKNTRMKVIDVNNGRTLGPYETGELCWKSPYIMKGYYGNLRATKETINKDGWLHSGDFAYYDENGELYIRDRIKDAININGVIVYPSEIESVLENHSAVCEAGVVSVSNDANEEHPIAFVSKIPGEEVTAEELIKLVADNLEEYKHLRGGVRFLDKLPLTDTHKIAKNQLREMTKYEL